MRRIPFPVDSNELVELGNSIQQGAVIAFPTETFYAVGGNAFLESVHQKIYSIKQRIETKPLLLLILPEWLESLTESISPKSQQLIDHFWPGPLTLIFKAHPELPSFLTRNQQIALRFSPQRGISLLLKQTGCPLIGTSANLSGSPACVTADEVCVQIGDSLDYLLDGGPTAGGYPSTVVNTLTDPFLIEREGVILSPQLDFFL